MWNDDNNKAKARPSEVVVELFADGVSTKQSVKLNEANQWTASFDKLPVNNNGKAVVYTLKELSVKNYTAKVTGNVTNGFTITNTYTERPTLPKTGSETVSLFLPIVMIGLGAMLLTYRKKED